MHMATTSYRPLTVHIKSVVCTLKPITAPEYVGFFEKSLPIFQNYGHYFALDDHLKREAPDFDHPRLYAALKALFGESNITYDHYKCSFGYQFLLNIVRKERQSEYVLNFTDIKGGISFIFGKILTPAEMLEKHQEKDKLHNPFEDDFSKDEMAYFMTWFIFFLVGFMKGFAKSYHETFARSLDYCLTIYGFRDNEFFLDSYEDKEAFHAAKSRLLQEGNIPFNRVKANPLQATKDETTLK